MSSGGTHCKSLPVVAHLEHETSDHRLRTFGEYGHFDGKVAGAEGILKSCATRHRPYLRSVSPGIESGRTGLLVAPLLIQFGLRSRVDGERNAQDGETSARRNIVILRNVNPRKNLGMEGEHGTALISLD